MDIQKVASTGTAVAVLGGGTLMGGNYALDQATGGPEKRIKEGQRPAAGAASLTPPMRLHRACSQIP